MEKRSYTFVVDPGHAWLVVPLSDIQDSGIAADISRYSYVNEGFAYLEEDVDAGLFIRAMQARGYQVDTDSVFEEKTQIRSFARFLPKAVG